MSGGKKSSVIGHRYYFGIHMGIGRGPVDTLHEVKVGDRQAWAGDVSSNTTINIDAYNLFGGEEKEGGVQGPLQLMFGEPDQVPASGLLAMLGAPLSGFRRMFTVFYDGLVAMNNPYPKVWAFRFNRILKGWDGAVFEPALARIPLGNDGVTFTTVILDMPLNGPGAHNNGVATIIHPERLPVEHDRYINDTLWNRAGGDILLQELHFDYGPGDLAWQFDQPLQEFDVLESSIELVSYEVDPGAGFIVIDSNVLFETLPEGSGPAGSVGFYYSLQFDGTAFRLYFGGTYEGEYVVPISTTTLPESVSFKVRMDRFDRVTRFYFNGEVCHSVPWHTPSDFSIVGIRKIAIEHVGVHSTLDPDIYTQGKYRNLKLYGTGQHHWDLYSMNGAHIIFECLTNREWGRGLSRSKIDQGSFTVCAQQLFDEDFGLCMKWTRKDTISAFIQTVLNHIAGVLYQSRLTGLMTLKLIRDDYDVEDLPVYTTENGLLEVKPSGIGSSASSVNAVTVKWHDPLTDEDRFVSIKNTAAVLRNNGAMNSTTNDYSGVPSASLALRLAQRDLRVVSTNLRRFTVTADRSLDHLNPGDVFALRDDARGVPAMVVRIGKANYGNLVNGKITFEVVQDVFTMPAQSFVAEVPNNFTPPDTKPCVDQQHAFEAPYFLLAGRMSAADFAYVKEDGGYFGAVASKGKPINLGVQMYVRQSAPTPEDIPTGSDYVCGI